MNRFRRKDVGETNEEYIRRLNYEELEEKYDIHKYYPQYIHNGEVSTPQLRAMIKDKPIYHGVKPRQRPTEQAKAIVKAKANETHGVNGGDVTGQMNGHGSKTHQNGAAETKTLHVRVASGSTKHTHDSDNDEQGGYAERRGTIATSTAMATSGVSTKTEPMVIPMAVSNGNSSGGGSKIGNFFRNPFKDQLGVALSFDQSKSEMTMRRKLEMKDDSDHMRRNSVVSGKGKAGQAPAPPTTRAGNKMSRIRGNSGASNTNKSGGMGPGLATAQGKGTYRTKHIPFGMEI